MIDWVIIGQEDFSGGINWMDDPANLKDSELADCRNVRLTTKKTLEKRFGYTKYNSSAPASAAVRKLFHFLDYSGSWIPLAQIGNDLYKGSAAFPNTGSFTSIHTGSTGAETAFIDAMWGKLIYTNGIDVPQVWEGTYGKCHGFKKTTDNGSTYIDYTAQVSDKDDTTYASIGSLNTLANGNWILIKSRVPKLTGLRIVMGSNVNTNTSTLTVQYWSGSSWTSVDNLSDGTSSGGKTFAQTGNVTFDECTCTLATFDKSLGYWLRLSVSAALSSTVSITGVYLYYNIQPLPNLWDGKTFKPDGFKKTTDSNVTYVDYTQYVTDNSLSSTATLDAFPTSTGYLYVQSVKKFRGIRVTMSVTNVNTNTSTLSATYWNGSSWASLTISDGTSANSKTLAQSGEITWEWPSDIQKRSIGNDTDTFYQIRFAVNATLSSSVSIAEIECLPVVEPLRPHRLLIYHKNRAWLANRVDAPNYLYYSAQFLPDVWDGDDAGYIGIPSGKEITALCRFYNDLFIATPDEIYILQGYTPATFGLLKINTGNVGVVAPHSVVPVGKYIYFLHSTGFYRFDGIGVVYISNNIQKLFDKNDSSAIPDSMLKSVQGRFDRVHNCIEWCIRSGTGTTNNLVLLFDINNESWYVDDISASCLLTTTDAYYRDIKYHGDYSGYVYRDDYGSTDDGIDITAYITTRGFNIKDRPLMNYIFRGCKARFDAETSGSITVYYSDNGATFTSLGTMLLVNTGFNNTIGELYTSIKTTSPQLKLSSTSNFSLTHLEAFLVPVRGVDAIK